MEKSKTLFLTLQTFSATGGIEKVCKVAGMALSQLADENSSDFSIYSMHDKQHDFKAGYFPEDDYRGFAGNKLIFSIHSIIKGWKSDVVFLSHINLLIVGYSIKLISPNTKLLLFAHGIEVWKPLTWWKKKMLKGFTRIISVSRFTNSRMMKLQEQARSKCVVLNNCLDPFLENYPTGQKDQKLIERYGLNSKEPVLLTLSRLSSHDREKGYDKVLFSLKELRNQFPGIRYLVVGKYQEAEKLWLDKLISDNGLTDAVVFTGYVSDDELAAHISLADVYVMPSRKEGFGIIFIEAMFYGKPVVAGNRDGSPDTLINNEFGLLVDPNNQQEITEAIRTILLNKEAFVPDRKKLQSRFGFEVYKRNLKKILEDLNEAEAA